MKQHPTRCWFSGSLQMPTHQPQLKPLDLHPAATALSGVCPGTTCCMGTFPGHRVTAAPSKIPTPVTWGGAGRWSSDGTGFPRCRLRVPQTIISLGRGVTQHVLSQLQLCRCCRCCSPLQPVRMCWKELGAMQGWSHCLGCPQVLEEMEKGKPQPKDSSNIQSFSRLFVLPRRGWAKAEHVCQPP